MGRCAPIARDENNKRTAQYCSDRRFLGGRLPRRRSCAPLGFRFRRGRRTADAGRPSAAAFENRFAEAGSPLGGSTRVVGHSKTVALSEFLQGVFACSARHGRDIAWRANERLYPLKVVIQNRAIAGERSLAAGLSRAWPIASSRPCRVATSRRIEAAALEAKPIALVVRDSGVGDEGQSGDRSRRDAGPATMVLGEIPRSFRNAHNGCLADFRWKLGECGECGECGP